MSPINVQAYIPTDAYRAMLDQLMVAPAAPGHDLRTRLVEILGAAGVWPISCLEDRLDEWRRRREREEKKKDEG